MAKGGIAKRMLQRLTNRQAKRYNNPASLADIPKFITTYNINVDEILHPVGSSEYATFNDFFARRLNPSARPLDAPDDTSVRSK